MQKTIKIKLVPTKEQQAILDRTSKAYIATVNMLVSEMVKAEKVLDISTKEFFAYLPSSIKNQCIRDAKSIYKKHTKGVTKSIAILKKPVCIWNNQNFSIEDTAISFPVWLGKSQKISVRAIIPTKYKALFEMGVDLGIKVPAVCVTSNNEVKFIGNGRENKYIRRYYKSKRKALGKAKKLNAVKKLNNKEQRIMQDKDHKYSRQIVNFALENNVSTIRLEELANIRNTTRTSRKNNYSLHRWSFYRLAQFIEYKAQLVGIKVEYVDPKYTSQTCPNCGEKNKAKDRLYTCECGYTTHRDLVGARNILTPMMHGNSASA